MFNLDQSISEWRQQMLAAGIKTPVPLEELEIHLREDVERQMQSGVNAQNALEAAMQRVGQADVLKNEFGKVERTFMKKIMIILLGIFGVLFGPAVFLPALAKYRHQEVWNSDVIMPIVAGAVITVVGLATTIFGFKKRKA
jgi:H+/Cl- antiporter ClcA